MADRQSTGLAEKQSDRSEEPTAGHFTDLIPSRPTDPPAKRANKDLDKPPASLSKAVQKALKAHGDQALSAEIGEFTITLGRRHVYLNVDGKVHVLQATPVEEE